MLPLFGHCIYPTFVSWTCFIWIFGTHILSPYFDQVQFFLGRAVLKLLGSKNFDHFFEPGPHRDPAPYIPFPLARSEVPQFEASGGPCCCCHMLDGYSWPKSWNNTQVKWQSLTVTVIYSRNCCTSGTQLQYRRYKITDTVTVLLLLLWDLDCLLLLGVNELYQSRVGRV